MGEGTGMTTLAESRLKGDGENEDLLASLQEIVQEVI